MDETAGIVKAYEAVTQYCGWHAIEAGKTMGLFPYGEPNEDVPKLFKEYGIVDRNVIIPTYPNAGHVNYREYPFLDEHEFEDLTKLKTVETYHTQYRQRPRSSSQIDLQSAETTGKKNVVLSGGYGLNCVANYWYLDKLKKDGINLFVEPR